MVGKAILYTSLLIAFIAFILLYEKGFSFKNSFTIALFAPLVGGLFFVAGVFAATFFTALLVFGAIMYALNKRKVMKFRSKNMKFKVYRV